MGRNLTRYLERSVGYERAQEVDVGDEGLEVGVLVGNVLPLVLVVQPEDTLLDTDVIAVPALGEVAVEGVLLGLGRVDRVI